MIDLDKIESPTEAVTTAVQKLVAEHQAMATLLGEILCTIRLPQNQQVLDHIAQEWKHLVDVWQEKYMKIGE